MNLLNMEHQENIKKQMRVAMKKHLQLWLTKERKLVRFYQQPAQLFNDMTLVHTTFLEDLNAGKEEIRQKYDDLSTYIHLY